MTTYEDDPYDELNMDENDLEETLASLGHALRLVVSLENENHALRERMATLETDIGDIDLENHALREELNETRRDRDELQAQLEDVRYIQRTLPPVEYQ